MQRMTAVLGVAFTLAAWSATLAESEPRRDIELPPPRMEGGKPLMEALRARQTSRAIGTAPLPQQVLSDLLWAAFGVNRPENGRRTAPSAKNWQEVELYVVMEAGTYLYVAASNRLAAVAAGDRRGLAGKEAYATGAPLNIVFVSDESRMGNTSPEDRLLYSAASAGSISQNIYLFCASEGLATVVRASVDRRGFAAALGLPEHKRVLLAQTVGYPNAAGQP